MFKNKVTSIMLVFIMIFSVSAPAFADETNDLDDRLRSLQDELEEKAYPSAEELNELKQENMELGLDEKPLIFPDGDAPEQLTPEQMEKIKQLPSKAIGYVQPIDNNGDSMMSDDNDIKWMSLPMYSFIYYTQCNTDWFTNDKSIKSVSKTKDPYYFVGVEVVAYDVYGARFKNAFDSHYYSSYACARVKDEGWFGANMMFGYGHHLFIKDAYSKAEGRESHDSF